MTSAIGSPAPTDDVQVSDTQHIANTLTWLGEQGHDIAPEVFVRYLARHPESASLFRVVDPTQPPHGCGQMVFEMLLVLQDNAAGKPYVAGYLRDLAIGHKAFGVQGLQPYADLLQALVDTVNEHMSGEGSALQAAAWARQTRALFEQIRNTALSLDSQ